MGEVTIWWQIKVTAFSSLTGQRLAEFVKGLSHAFSTTTNYYYYYYYHF